MTSQYFNKRAIKGLNKIGDILIPGDDEYPSFSAYQCTEHIDDLVAFAPSDDISALGMVLLFLALFLNFALSFMQGKGELS